MSLYKVKYGIKNGVASTAETAYYEDEERLKVDLLSAHLEEMTERSSRPWGEYMIRRLWIKKLRGDEGTRQRVKIYGVHKMVNDEWQPVEFTVVEPEIHID